MEKVEFMPSSPCGFKPQENASPANKWGTNYREDSSPPVWSRASHIRTKARDGAERDHFLLPRGRDGCLWQRCGAYRRATLRASAA